MYLHNEHGGAYLLRPTYAKVDMPNMITYLNWTFVYESYLVRCDSKNKYQKDMCLKMI